MCTRTIQLYDQLFQRGKDSQPGAAPDDDPAAPAAAAESQASEEQGQEEQEQQEAHEGLVSLVQSSVDSFFHLLYAKVDQSLDASQQQQQQPYGVQDQQSQGGVEGAVGTTAAAAAAAAELELDPVALGGVVAAVQQLVSDVETVDPHVPQVRREDDREGRGGEGRGGKAEGKAVAA